MTHWRHFRVRPGAAHLWTPVPGRLWQTACGRLRVIWIEEATELRGGTVVVIDRFAPSSKMCCQCGQLHDMPLNKRRMECDCGNIMDRDHNAAINILKFGLDTLTPDLKRAQESHKTTVRRGAGGDGAKMPALSDFHRSARLA